MAAVIICSDFGAKKKKSFSSYHAFSLFPFIAFFRIYSVLFCFSPITLSPFSLLLFHTLRTSLNPPPGARVIISDYFHSLLGLTCVFSPFFACQGECHLLLPGSGSSRGTSVINYLGCLSGHHLDNSSAKILRSFFFHFLKTIIHFLSASLLLGVILGAIQWVLFHRKFFSLIAWMGFLYFHCDLCMWWFIFIYSAPDWLYLFALRNHVFKSEQSLTVFIENTSLVFFSFFLECSVCMGPSYFMCLLVFIPDSLSLCAICAHFVLSYIPAINFTSVMFNLLHNGPIKFFYFSGCLFCNT